MRLTVLTCVLLVASISAAAASPARDDLKGTVTADGRPLPGATVMIYTAAVKVGTSTFCPSCYADCGKRAVTDNAGRFTIASLDPELAFRVLVVADGYSPTFVQHVNPSVGPIAAKLDPTPNHLDPARVLRGKVVGPDGEAVVGAEVSPKFSGLGELAITDARGEFLLVANHAVPQRVMLGVDARGFAPHVFDSIDAAKGAVTLSVDRGATVTGHALRDGKPLAGVDVRIVQADRNASSFTAPRTIATSADGRFEFDNVGPPGKWFVSVTLASLAKSGDATDAIPRREVQVDGDGTESHAGDLSTVLGHRLAGRVMLSDGHPVPPGTRVMVDREDAWDDLQIIAGPDGSFTVPALPAEAVTVGCRVKGYFFSPRNRSLNRSNQIFLEGLVDRDVTDLVVLLEPGPTPPFPKSTPELWEATNKLKQTTLAGAPAALATPGEHR